MYPIHKSIFTYGDLELLYRINVASEKVVDEYVVTKRFTYCPRHPTNTCDPYTGIWEEQLIPTEWLESILREEGFRVEILAGYYYFAPSAFKRFIKSLLKCRN